MRNFRVEPAAVGLPISDPNPQVSRFFRFPFLALSDAQYEHFLGVRPIFFIWSSHQPLHRHREQPASMGFASFAGRVLFASIFILSAWQEYVSFFSAFFFTCFGWSCGRKIWSFLVGLICAVRVVCWWNFGCEILGIFCVGLTCVCSLIMTRWCWIWWIRISLLLVLLINM